MKNLLRLSFLLVITTASFAQAANEYAVYNDFLMRLGFEKYTAQIQKTLETERMKELAHTTLTTNASRYQVVDSSRILTLVIVEGSFPRFGDRKLEDRVLDLAAYLLEPHPLMTREPLPPEVNDITDSKAYVAARMKFLKGKLFERYNQERQTLLENVSDLAPSQPPADLDALIQNYLLSKYTDRGLQQTRYWGRALSASIVRYARLNHRPDLEERLKQKVAAKGLALGNFLSSTVSYLNENKQWVSLKIANGDFVNEYSKGSDAFFISLGVEPSDPDDKRYARQQKLIGSKMYMGYYPLPEAERKIIDKVRDRQPLTFEEQGYYEFMTKNVPVQGYSHVGILDIRRDAETGIEMPWVWDIYPNAGLGGVRFLGLEGFAYAEKFRKIGFVHYDAKKFHDYYVSKTKEQGYLAKVWKSWAAAFDTEGNVMEDRSESYEWPSHISEADVKRLQTMPVENADRWYSQEIVPRVLKVMKGYMVSKEALAFARNFANIESASYCSEVLVIAFLQGVNVDPQMNRDQFSSLLKVVQVIKKNFSQYFNVNERIVAPSGFAWQSQLVGSHTMIDLYPTPKFRVTSEMLAPLKPRLGKRPLPNNLPPAPAKMVEFIEDDL